MSAFIAIIAITAIIAIIAIAANAAIIADPEDPADADTCVGTGQSSLTAALDIARRSVSLERAILCAIALSRALDGSSE